MHLRTQRQLQCLRLVADGRSQHQIAAQLYVSQRTVKSDLAAVCRQLGADNTTHAVSLAHRCGILPVDCEPSR